MLHRSNQMQLVASSVAGWLLLNLSHGDFFSGFLPKHCTLLKGKSGFALFGPSEARGLLRPSLPSSFEIRAVLSRQAPETLDKGGLLGDQDLLRDANKAVRKRVGWSAGKKETKREGTRFIPEAVSGGNWDVGHLRLPLTK